MRPFTLFVLVLFVLVTAGCGGGKSTAPTTKSGPKRAVIAFLDTSRSVSGTPAVPEETPWQAGIREQLGVLYKLMSDLPRYSVHLEIYTFGSHREGTKRRVVQKYKDMPRKETNLDPVLMEIMKEGPQHLDGTHFAPTLKKLAERCERIAQVHPEIPVAALFLTDGGVDDLKDAIKEGEEAYDECDNLRYIHAAPVRDEMRERLDKVFASFQEDDRFDYSDTLDLEGGYRKLMTVLQQPLSHGGL